MKRSILNGVSTVLAAALLVPTLANSKWKISSAGALSASTAYALHDEDPKNDKLPETVMKIGKDGQVNLKDDMMVGATLLKKGRYLIEHRIEEDEHWFRFTLVPAKSAQDHLLRTADVRARRNSLRQMIKSSTVHALHDEHEYRIVE